jgi:thymidylate synthase
MSFNYWSESLQDIHKTLMMTLHDDYDCLSAPRGKPIKELIAASFTLDNPRNRLIVSPARAVNYGFAVGELCWYVRGDSDLATMSFYNKRMSQFSDDGQTINSAYGARMFKNRWDKRMPPRTAQQSGPPLPPESVSQFDLVVEELKRDPDSRRAVMHINEPSDLLRAVERGSKDVPCTMSLQLFIRDKKLHMHVLMRSNDVVWGLPYDVFSFTCLQEAFLYSLQEAGVEVDDLGTYNHTAGSLHVYDTHFTMAEEVSKEPDVDVAPMKPFTFQQLSRMSDNLEPQIRQHWEGWRAGSPLPPDTDDETIRWMVDELCKHKQKRIEEDAKRAQREQGLLELTRLTEEMGGYEDLKETK